MTDFRLISNIAICACTGIGFIYGMIRCFGKDYPLFLKAIVGSMGCMMAGRLFAIVLELCGGKTVDRLNLGYVGLVGSFLFLFSAAHGEIDDRVKPYRSKPATVISLIAPLPILILLYMIITDDVSVPYKILGCFISLVALYDAVYYFRYMISPDGGDGLLKMLRPTCAMLLVFCYAHLGEIYYSIRENSIMLMITNAIICVIGLVVIPLTERRVSKWMNI